MKNFVEKIIAIYLLVTVTGGNVQARKPAIPPLPEAISNNAVAAIKNADGIYIASFNGLGEGKNWQDVQSKFYLWNNQDGNWHLVSHIPGKGKLASTAAAIGESFYLSGGYTVDAKAHEVTTSEIYKISPPYKKIELLTHMPVPVDDSQLSVYQNRYLVLISGWHDNANTVRVQLYDTVRKRWLQGTTFPGVAVFGHSGAIVGNQVLVTDGVGVVGVIDGKRQFANIAQTWLGTFKPDSPGNIKWEKLDRHPGKPRYRMGAVAVPERQWIIYIGGSENPYNYTGIGYNKVPSEPQNEILIFDVNNKCWLKSDIKGPEVMDLRNVVKLEQSLFTIGGMKASQQVTPEIHSLNINDIPENLPCY